MAPAINWAAIDWVSLVALSLLVLLVARIGERLSFGSRGLAAFITALLFAAGFAVWSYAPSRHAEASHRDARSWRPGLTRSQRHRLRQATTKGRPPAGAGRPGDSMSAGRDLSRCNPGTNGFARALVN